MKQSDWCVRERPTSWQAQLRADPLPWLLQADAPGVRYLALRDLLDLLTDDPELRAAGCAPQRPHCRHFGPHGYSDKPSGNWWKFGFPVFYVTNLLQNVEALVALGYGHDTRLAHALDIIWAKQDTSGRWLLEYDYIGKTWVDFGPQKQPNPWVTLRALRVLKAVV